MSDEAAVQPPRVVRLTRDEAELLADCFGWPSKTPVFEFTNENGNLFGSYDSGLDYQRDGHTFEWEWKITNPFQGNSNQ